MAKGFKDIVPGEAEEKVMGRPPKDLLTDQAWSDVQMCFEKNRRKDGAGWFYVNRKGFGGVDISPISISGYDRLFYKSMPRRSDVQRDIVLMGIRSAVNVSAKKFDKAISIMRTKHEMGIGLVVWVLPVRGRGAVDFFEKEVHGSVMVAFVSEPDDRDEMNEILFPYVQAARLEAKRRKSERQRLLNKRKK